MAAPSRSGAGRRKRPAAGSPGPKRPARKKPARPPAAPRPPRRPAPRGRAARRLALRGARWCLVAAIWVAVALGAALAWYAWDLPELSTVETPTRRPAVALRAADGTVFARYGELHSGPVRFEDLPPYFVQAVSATEDRRFFEHRGIDPFGILRAAVANIRAGGVRQGGSTLTQQLAKNLFLTPARTLRRKVQEAIVALWLEARFTKRQIFEIYANRVYFGSGAYGARAAAARYFGAPVERLTLHQSALLAGLLKAPSRYSPSRSVQAARGRAGTVLAAMVDVGHLTPAQAEAARRTPLGLLPSPGAGSRYFADWTLARSTGYVGRAGADLTMRTTLDPRLQRAAERAVGAALAAEGGKSRAGQAAAVVMAADGAVRAMVGGRSYSASQFNRATQALRQPGSAFKLFVYLAGFEAGLAPDDVFVDEPVSVAGWRPRNYGGRFRGPVRLDRAFAESVNTVAVQVSERAGRANVEAAARRLGITTPIAAHPSIALGTSGVTLLELTAAYAALATGGAAVWPFGIEAIEGGDGAELFRRAGSGRRRVIADGHVRALRAMMRETVRAGTGRAAALGAGEGGKTGTSQSSRDAWFVGFAGGLAAGVWVGNDDETPMRGVTGGGMPARIWRAIMAEAVAAGAAGGRRP